MKVVFDTARQRVPIKAWIDSIDDGTMQQTVNLANLPFAFRHIALMPDAHHGYGMPIGGVLPAQGYVVPNAIGVDIGCGMHARRTNIEAGRLTARAGAQTTLLRKVLDTIQAVVPSGNGPIGNHKALQRWDEPTGDPGTVALLESGPAALRQAWARSGMQLGTLGGGNHFIELQADEEGFAWLMLHSGSRALGKQVCDHFNDIARELNERFHSVVPREAQLPYLPVDSPEGQAYLAWMRLCMAYALENRRRMLDAAVEALFAAVRGVAPDDEYMITEAVDTHHNYCIPGSALIQTPTGPKRMDALVPGDTIFSADVTTGVRPTRVKRWIKSGTKEILEIRTRTRCVRVSPNHPILTISVVSQPHPDRPWHEKRCGKQEFVTAERLRVGDLIVCVNLLLRMGGSAGVQRARLVGAMLGDGWVRARAGRTGNYTVGLAIGAAGEVVTDRYAALLSHVFPDARWRDNAPGSFGLTCDHRATYEAMLALGSGARSSVRDVPPDAFTWTVEERLALLAGYLDADGSVVKHGLLQFRSASQSLSRSLRELCVGCGLRVTTLRHSTRATNYGQNQLYGFQAAVTPGVDLDLWHPDKASKLRVCPPPGLGQRRRGYIELPESMYVEPIKSITRDGVEDVFDVEVCDPSHTFVCENVVVHNCDFEHHFGANVLVHRKGAVRARAGEMVIIPGSMETGSYIARGLGNRESFETCSHGAGRRLSRTAAKKERTSEEVLAALREKGIEIAKRGHADVAEEAGHAYKDVDQVMEDSRDLVEPVYRLRPLGVVKG